LILLLTDLFSVLNGGKSFEKILLFSSFHQVSGKDHLVLPIGGIPNPIGEVTPPCPVKIGYCSVMGD
jgi:hypothetical protein